MSEKIPKTSSLNLPPTWKQTKAITRLAVALGIPEPIEETPSNRVEARNLIYRLRQQLRDKKVTPIS